MSSILTASRSQRFLALRLAPISDFLQMLPQPAHNRLALGISEFLTKFFEREVKHVMMMDLLGSHIIAQLKPNAMQQINFLWRESEFEMDIHLSFTSG